MTTPSTHRGGEPHDCAYRIEADEAMRDYDALEVDAGVMVDALARISEGRRNKAFDPWVRELAKDTLANLSERATGIRHA